MKDGDILAGKYKIMKIIGQGGMGKVYLAENMSLGTCWAIKEMNRKNCRDFDLMAEPNMLKKLEHPSLPRIFDIIETSESIYLVVDYIEGISLEKAAEKQGVFEEVQVLEWAIQLCGVLDYLHSYGSGPIIYRDIKPSNIMLTPAGMIKLIDFGIAGESGEERGNTVYIGTRGYAAPEQYGKGRVSVRTDIYSLGMTIHFLLTGKNPADQPFAVKPARDYNKRLSTKIEEIISRCTRMEPDDRYPNIKELEYEIGQLLLKHNTVKAASKGIGSQSTSQVLNNPASKVQTVNASFKRLVMTVWGNSMFGCEFAYAAARLSSYRVLLIDLDLLAPSADLYLDVKKYPSRFSGTGGFAKTGLDAVMEAAGRNLLSRELFEAASVKRKDTGNLYIITGSYRLDNYEYFTDDYLLKIIDRAYLDFDITVILTNKFIYDSYTVLSLCRSDYNIAAIPPDIASLREYNNYLSFLSEKQGVPLDKTKFVAYGITFRGTVDMELFSEATGFNTIGAVKKSFGFHRPGEGKEICVADMSKDTEKEYRQILGSFHITKRQGIAGRIAASFSEMLQDAVKGVKNAGIENSSQAAAGQK